MKQIRPMLIIALLVLNAVALASTPEHKSASISSTQAIQMLKEGNERFVTGKLQFPNQDAAALERTAPAQHPKATILSCSDSRVPVEKIFDMGIGDLFVVRVAGNVCDVDETGTIEYGVDHLGTPVLLVLGHTKCGAVTAVATNATVHGSIPPLVENIKPAVERAHEAQPNLSGKDLVPSATVENVWQSIADLIQHSAAIREKIIEGKLKVIGGVYHLEDSKVEWLGPHPRQNYLLVHASSSPLDHDANYYATMHREWPDISEVEPPEGVTGQKALEWLKEGNERFTTGKQTFPNLDGKHLDELLAGQHPFATVLTCSDSRLPAEEIFDAGAGDIFVVRVAGNVADVDETGSIEYGVGHVGTPLLVVMGHSSCGAVTAVATGAELPGSIPTLVDNIKPAVDKAAQDNPKLSGKDLVPAAIEANVWQSMEDLYKNSPEICALVKSGKLMIQGAVYHIDNGSVEWLGPHPQQNKFVKEQYTACLSGGKHEEASNETSTHETAAVTPAESHETPAAESKPANHRGQEEPSSKLDEAMKTLEANLKSVSEPTTTKVEPSQAKTATHETAAPASTRGASVSPKQDNADLAALNTEIGRLRSQVTQLSSSLEARRVSESALANMMTDIEYLKSENAKLKGQTEQTSKMLASLDDVTAPAVNAPQMDKLAALVTTLNESIEKQKSVTKPTINAPTVKHGTIQMTGFVHEQYYSKFATQDKSTFDTKRVRLGVSGDINPYAKIEIVGDFAKTPKLVDGYLALSPGKNWNVRVGQHKIPFSTDVMRSSTAMPFVNLSLAAALGPDRDIGLTVKYGTKFSKTSGIDLYTGLSNGAGINASDANTDKNYVFRAETKIADMFTIAPNWYFGKTNDTGALKQNLSTYGGSVTWTWKQEVLEAEYIGSKIGATKKEGWSLWGGHTFPTTVKFLPEIQMVARYEQYNPSIAAINDKANRVTLGTNLFIDKKYTEIQLNYQFNGEQGTSVKNDEFLLNFQVAF